jgi:hypothetical protein
MAWPHDALPLASGFVAAWHDAWQEEPTFRILPLLHPSAQNMSPFAGEETLFHRRMLEARDALIAAVETTLHVHVPHPRPDIPRADGIYGLPEWRERIASRHDRFDELWRRRGI